jgi:F0F1-type ATP synthase membrane subunit b/b'
MVQVENLKRHVASCGFFPVQCSNDGCNVLVNASDKLHHETDVCDFRKLKCHDCGQLKNEVKEMKNEIKNEMKGMKEEMKNEIKTEMKGMKEEMKSEIKNEVKEEMKEIIDQVLVHQDQMHDRISSEVKEEVKNEVRDMKVEMKNEMKEMIENEMKGMKEEIKNEMKEIVTNAVRDAMAGTKGLEVEMQNSNQSSQATCSADTRENIFVVGGYHKQGGRTVKNTSTECFNWADQTWTLLDSAVFEGRFYSCSFLYKGQMVVAGGSDGNNKTNTMKCLNIADPVATWKDFAVNLPVKSFRHKVINHNDQLFMSGGCVESTDPSQTVRSDAVYEVQLVPPYSSKMLTRLPQARSSHGMEMFDQKLFILGGIFGTKTSASVFQYDLNKSECKEMPPLPYAVREVGTVIWQNNVLLIGGRDAGNTPLNKFAMYDVITGRSQMLPSMKHKRYGCTAVLTGNIVVVMGGKNGKDDCLKSVECFDLERQVWQDLPDMLETRAYATAVVKPNH